MYYTKINTPVEDLFLIYDDNGAVETSFFETDQEFLRYCKQKYPDVAVTYKQIATEAIGKDFLFKNLQRYTPFQQLVWQATYDIPVGSVYTYKQIAKKIGKEKAARAVGNALHINPLPYLVPCHRVVASNHIIGNYALGTAMKQALLQAEGVQGLRTKKIAP